MILPQKGLKAKDLPKPLFQEELEKITLQDLSKRELLAPHKEVLAECLKYNQEYERNGRDRLYERFYSEVNGKETLRNQPLEQSISSMSRHKDRNGEWLTFQMAVFGKNWRGNRVDYWYDQGGRIDGMPEFHVEVDPQTEQVIPESTQINGIKTKYVLPFTKEKVNELLEFAGDDTIGFSVKERGDAGRRYSCTLEEFRDLPFDELIALKTEYMHSDWYKTRKLIEQRTGGGGITR
jgi:hypothetical protein